MRQNCAEGLRMADLPERPLMAQSGPSTLFPCPPSAMCGRLRVGKRYLHVAGLVGAAMCSAFRCGSHDRWP